jgi:hypothetical protein
MSGSMSCATGRCAISALVGPFDRKRPCPEVGSAHARLFPLVVVTWLPDVTKGHLTPSEFSWVSATGSCATPVVVVNNVGWSVLYDVRVL